MMPAYLRQRGQALVEALLMLPLLTMAFLAVAWVGKLQFAAQEMAQASRRAVMASAAGAPLARPIGAGAQSGRSQSMPGAAASGNAGLQAEWFGADLQLLAVTAGTALSGSALWNAARIARRTSVAAGAGYAHGDDDAQRRIGAAPTAWRRAADRSLPLARSIGGGVGRVDAPWGRPAITTDWLSSWADLVPADRLGKRGRMTP